VKVSGYQKRICQLSKKEQFFLNLMAVGTTSVGKIIPQNTYNSFVMYALLKRVRYFHVALFFLILS